jgi:serine/threonine-protein kinase RsbW
MAEPDPSSPHSDPDRISVNLPLVVHQASTLRTMAAAIGADAGFSIDELDDLRLAMSEIVAALAEPGSAPTRLTTSFVVRDGVLEVEMTSDDGRRCDLDELSSAIMASVTDSFEVDGAMVRFRKRPVEQTPQ